MCVPVSEVVSITAFSTPLLFSQLYMFFVFSGAECHVEVFGQPMLVLIGLIYILVRSAGKYFGAMASAQAVRCSPKVVRYLGVTLLPQAGVALGMCVTAQQLGGADGTLVRNIILFSVLIYELVGPLMTKQALKAAGEITEKPKEVVERRKRLLAAAKPKEAIQRLDELKQHHVTKSSQRN